MKSCFVEFHPDLEVYKGKIQFDDLEDDLQDSAMEFFNKYNGQHAFYAYQLCTVEKNSDNKALIGGCSFEGKALTFLKDKQQVAVYTASCGSLDNTIYPDPLDSFFSETLKRMACECAFTECRKEIAGILGNNLASMNPGSGSADLWPISQLKGIFEILGDDMPVKLSPSGLIVPVKSNAGVMFIGDGKYRSCLFCGRENCPERDKRYKMMQEAAKN